MKRSVIKEIDKAAELGLDIVQIEEIDQYEYEQLRNMHCKTYQEIIDEYTLLLIKGGII